jgi:6-phosphofructokinase 1
LIEGEYKYMTPEDFSGILTRGGTILGTSRQSYRSMYGQDGGIGGKVAAMKV